MAFPSSSVDDPKDPSVPESLDVFEKTTGEEKESDAQDDAEVVERYSERILVSMTPTVKRDLITYAKGIHMKPTEAIRKMICDTIYQ